MPVESIISDAFGHFGAGIVVALGDYITHKVANPKAKRIEQKKEALKSIDLILQANAKTIDVIADGQTPAPIKESVAKDSLQYALNNAVAMEYLVRAGIIKNQLPLRKRAKEFFRKLWYDERINNMTNTQKFGLSVGMEFFGDTVIGLGHYMHDLKLTSFAGVTLNLYQVPMFFAGLWVGNYMKKTINWCITPGEEKKLDKTLQQLMRETAIVDLVLAYEPPAQIKSQLEHQGVDTYRARLTSAGKSALKGITQFAGGVAATASNTVQAVTHYSERKAEEEEQHRADAKKRFDDLTSGR